MSQKKRNSGRDKWHGFGGHAESGETVVAAALRELHEESTLTATIADLDYRGSLTFLLFDA